MSICKLTKELSRLRKSSSDSIDNVENFTTFKKYMHVVRAVEEDLKIILRNVNKFGKKTLVLLCGSAGDGKSHLLSYLKNSDEEKLIKDFVVYNDATESSAPSKTAIETLNDLLSDFRDEQLECSGKNIILAINLGVLSNFVESEYGEQYKELRKYVEEHNILTSKIIKKEFDTSSFFQHISFSDYHMYSLSSDGVKAVYIEKIMDKIFGEAEGNVFYSAYKSCSNCSLSKKCPVCKNYEYMQDKVRQQFIAELLVKMTLMDKVILTTREILNFIYDIIVSKDFSYTNFQKLLVDDSAYIKEFLKQITPALLFESNDLTPLMNIIKKYDPLLYRTEKDDQMAISYYISSDVSKDVYGIFNTISYGEVVCNSVMLEKINNDKALKKQIFNLMVRINVLEHGIIEKEVYSRYLTDLYFYNAGKGRKLGALYTMVEKSIIQWCGSDIEGNICLDNGKRGFAIYENIKFEGNLDLIPKVDDAEELQRFIPKIVVTYKDKRGKYISLDIDYSLYELLFKLTKGYVQTVDDRNNHADFISFVKRILQTGSLDEEVTIISNSGKRAMISKNMFGYKFKVVK